MSTSETTRSGNTAPEDTPAPEQAEVLEPDEIIEPEREQPQDADTPDGAAEPEPVEQSAEGAEPDADPAAEAGDPAQPPPPREPTLLERLQAELFARDEQLKTYIAAHKQALGEMDAERDRLRRDRQRALDLDRMELSRKLLDVADNLDRSLLGIPNEGPVADLAKGVRMVHKQFLDVLVGFGVERVDCLGERFDPARHEAMGMVPASGDQEDQEIIHVDRAGYTFGGKLLRAARVIVAAR